MVLSFQNLEVCINPFLILDELMVIVQGERIFELFLRFASGYTKKTEKFDKKEVISPRFLSEGCKVGNGVNMKKKMEGCKWGGLAENYGDPNGKILVSWVINKYDSWCVIIGGIQINSILLNLQVVCPYFGQQSKVVAEFWLHILGFFRCCSCDPTI